MRTLVLIAATFCVASVGAFNADASVVQLQNATATFSQADFGVNEAIDGSFAGNSLNGWAISPQITGQVAVFESVLNTPVGVTTTLTFQLFQLFEVSADTQHLIGNFRLSATTADRGLFADGLLSGGDIGDNSIWTVLTPTSATSAAGSTLTPQPDGSIIVSNVGPTPPTDVYSVVVETPLTEITGIRLEVLEHPSLPFNGPGTQPTTGNFVLTEICVDAVTHAPEPAAILVWLGLGTAASVAVKRRR